MRRSLPQDWKPSRPAMKRYKHIWNKPWPELSKMYKETRSSLNESPDHPGQSKQFRPSKRQLLYSDETTQNQNTKFQNMPPGTDAGNAHQGFTPYPSRIYSSMTSRTITTTTRSLETKWCRSSNKIRNWQIKFPKPIRHHQKNSKRTPSWPWSPRRWPHTCSSGTTTEIKEIPEQRISPRGENHFSKRMS